MADSQGGREYPLSKSKYCSGLQCLRLLYKTARMPEDIPGPDAATQFMFDQGNEVGAEARAQFPDGILIEREPWDTAPERTACAIEDGAGAIFEATFTHNGVSVMVDVFRRAGRDMFDIIEVKQSTKLKDEHIPDIAIQKYVVEGAGFRVNRAFLMHLNREYMHTNGGELFAMVDCTEQADVHLASIGANLDAQKAALARDAPPAPRIGPQCSRPRDCPLRPECWESIPELSVFNIPGYRKKWEMHDSGTISLDDIPAGAGLNARQERFMEAYRLGEPVFDTEAIATELAGLMEPLHFLDFETISWAIPRYAGTKPFQQVPFQWSVHTLSGVELSHREFLWDTKDDPRPTLTESLLGALGGEGAVVVYSSFEESRLRELAAAFPGHAEKIGKLIPRLWDLLDIFRNHYCDSRFRGSNSIKNVLPVLVPELSYSDLEIQEGGTASAMFARMIEDRDEGIRQALLRYCERDTLAMVEIYRKLRAAVR